MKVLGLVQKYEKSTKRYISPRIIYYLKVSKLKQLSNMGNLKKRVFYVYGGTMKVLYTFSCFSTVKEVHCLQLQRVYDILCRRYPAMVNRKRIIIQHDNARPHKSKKTQEKIKDLEISVLPHHAYSPDLAPSDYYLFRFMAHFLRGRCFQSAEELKMVARNSLLLRSQSGIEMD